MAKPANAMVCQARAVSQSCLAVPSAQEKGRFSGPSQSQLDTSAGCARAKCNPLIRNLGRKIIFFCAYRERLPFLKKGKKKILVKSCLFNKASEGSEHH